MGGTCEHVVGMKTKVGGHAGMWWGWSQRRGVMWACGVCECNVTRLTPHLRPELGQIQIPCAFYHYMYIYFLALALLE